MSKQTHLKNKNLNSLPKLQNQMNPLGKQMKIKSNSLLKLSPMINYHKNRNRDYTEVSPTLTRKLVPISKQDKFKDQYDKQKQYLINFK